MLLINNDENMIAYIESSTVFMKTRFQFLNMFEVELFLLKMQSLKFDASCSHVLNYFFVFEL